MSGRSPPLYCTLILITMHSHQSKPNIPTVVHSYEDNSTNNVDNSTIERYKNRGLGKHKNVGGGKSTSNSILYNIINWHARVSHKHKIHGKLGLQLSLLHYI